MENLSDQINGLHSSCTCDHHLKDLGADDNFDKLFMSMIKKLWRDKKLPENYIDEEVTAAIAERMWSGVVEGYGKDVISVDYDTPDYNMLTSLQENTWHFSGAKNYQQLRELGSALLNEEGKIRSFQSFLTMALAINDKYNKHWAKPEYNLAIAGGQMAGKWVQIQEDKKTLPLLQFDAVLDSQTTALCKSLDGTILPVGHAFWKRFYPPNHFGCRSTVKQLRSGKVTPDQKIPTADIPKMFRSNLAQEGLIFPTDHPYFIDAPAIVKDSALSVLKKREDKSK